MRFPRQEYWSGLPFPCPGDPPDPGMEPTTPALADGFFTTESPGKPYVYFITFLNQQKFRENSIFKVIKNNLQWNIIYKKKKTKSLCCTRKTNTTLQINYTIFLKIQQKHTIFLVNVQTFSLSKFNLILSKQNLFLSCTCISSSFYIQTRK